MSESASIEERAADAAAAPPTPEKPKKKRPTRAQAAIRDALILQRVAESWTWAMIAEEAGITSRQCQRVLRDYRAHSVSPLDLAPTALIEELATGYRQSVAIFTALASDADNTAAAVGAIKGANDAREKLVAVLQAVGHLPNDLGVLKLQRDVEQVARRMLDGVEMVKAGELDVDGLAAMFYDMAGLPPVPAGLPGGDGDDPA